MADAAPKKVTKETTVEPSAKTALATAAKAFVASAGRPAAHVPTQAVAVAVQGAFASDVTVPLGLAPLARLLEGAVRPEVLLAVGHATVPAATAPVVPSDRRRVVAVAVDEATVEPPPDADTIGAPATPGPEGRP